MADRAISPRFAIRIDVIGLFGVDACPWIFLFTGVRAQVIGLCRELKRFIYWLRRISASSNDKYDSIKVGRVD